MSEEENIPNQKSEEKPEDKTQSQPSNLPGGQAGVEPQTTNMETHAHHLHKAPGKNFWHYFFEFFMLFLAVFCGFFAENRREHFVEHKKEKEFISSLCKDLISDTIQLNESLPLRKKTIRNIDSLLYYLSMPDPDKYGKFIYHYARPIPNGFYFISNDRTIQQLKNAGNLRLIRNQPVSDSIMRYDWEIRRNDVRMRREEEFKMDYIDAMKQVFDGNEFNKMLNDKKTNFSDWDWPANNPPLLHKDKENLNRLINSLHFVKSIDLFEQNWSRDLINRASKLLTLLKKEYHLE